jgi:tripartite-type tricarboxylate transporter receptor subunit TctC
MFAAATASAQTFPQKPIRMIVPFAAGAGTDVIARTVTQKAAELIGQPIVIENRTGAGGNIGAAAAATAPADGYTLTVLSTIHAANQSFFRAPGYDMTRDFVPIAELGISPTLWVLRGDLGALSVPQLVQLGRASPGKYTYGSGGATHPAELFRVLTQTDLTVIPYRGVAAGAKKPYHSVKS